METYIGVDPGVAGGVACISVRERTQTVEAAPIPMWKDAGHRSHRLRADAFVSWVSDRVTSTDGAVVIGIEKQWARPNDGPTQSTKIVGGMMVLESLIDLIGLRYQLVTPQKWMKGMPDWEDWKVAAGNRKPSTLLVKHLFPALDLMPGKKRTPHDGMSDAVCIAYHMMQDRKRADPL